MHKVKDYDNWSRIIFQDRTILKADLKYMNWQQIRNLDNVIIDYAEDDENSETVTLFVYNY